MPQICPAVPLINYLKLFASRPLDIRDAEGVVIRDKDQLDWSYIEDQLRPLVEVKAEPEILETLPSRSQAYSRRVETRPLAR